MIYSKPVAAARAVEAAARREAGLLTTEEAAEYIGKNNTSLRHWRYMTKKTGKLHGPVFHKQGRLFVYLKGELNAFKVEQARIVDVIPGR